MFSLILWIWVSLYFFNTMQSLVESHHGYRSSMFIFCWAFQDLLSHSHQEVTSLHGCFGIKMKDNEVHILSKHPTITFFRNYSLLIVEHN